jgi:hypothetical protein
MSELAHTLLSVATAVGLATAFWWMKRLYGIDLELKAYREQRRVEYLEAKLRADRLAAESDEGSG